MQRFFGWWRGPARRLPNLPYRDDGRWRWRGLIMKSLFDWLRRLFHDNKSLFSSQQERAPGEWRWWG